uniref:Uncharacterized protein n=1 Tax=Otus sunia TaxID=257818 RepID=A0A8C8E7C2_9STRI
MKSTENKSTSSCPGSHRDMQTVCCKPAAANAAQKDRKPCWEPRAVLGYWDGYPPFQTFPALSGGRLKIYSLLLPPEPHAAGLSELTALTAVLALRWLPSANGFSQVRVGGHGHVSRTSHPGTVLEAFDLSTPLIHIQPHQYFLSSLSFNKFRPTQSTSLEVDATTIFNANCSKLQQCYLLLTNPPKIWFFFHS